MAPSFSPVKRMEITAGTESNPLPLMVLNNVAMHLDLSAVKGTLWDNPTTAQVTWGIVDAQTGRMFGRVLLKNGNKRTFFDATLIQPYVDAFTKQYAKLVPAK